MASAPRCADLLPGDLLGHCCNYCLGCFMKQVTIESVRERIARIEECAIRMPGGLRLSMNTEFELACLRALLGMMQSVQVLPSGWRMVPTESQPAPVTTDSVPSLNAMMRALDAFYADDEVPERAMLEAFKILVADVGKKPVPVKYNIGEATMLHIFTATGMTDVSDMQAVFDQVEKALVKLERKPKVIEPDGWRDMMARLANGLELMTSLASERAISVDTCVCLEWVRDARAMLDQEQPAPVVEREPIAWLNDAYLARGVVDGEAGSEDAGPGYIPVYRHAQPAPVVPEEKPIPNTLSMYAVDAVAAIAEVKGWNACRAAMLNQAQEPATDNTAQQFEALATGMSLKQLAVVTLPCRLDIDGAFMVPVDDGDYLDRDEVIEAIRAAGLDCREIDGKPSLTTDDVFNALATSAGSGKP